MHNVTIATLCMIQMYHNVTTHMHNVTKHHSVRMWLQRTFQNPCVTKCIMYNVTIGPCVTYTVTIQILKSPRAIFTLWLKVRAIVTLYMIYTCIYVQSPCARRFVRTAIFTCEKWTRSLVSIDVAFANMSRSTRQKGIFERLIKILKKELASWFAGETGHRTVFWEYFTQYEVERGFWQADKNSQKCTRSSVYRSKWMQCWHLRICLAVGGRKGLWKGG